MTKVEWIDVNEQLPEIKKKVILWTEVIGFTAGFYWGTTKDTDPCKGWSIATVTHWQEVPEGPNK